MLEKATATTRYGKYTYVQYARFADDLVILIDSYPRHEWLVKAVERRLREELVKLRVEIDEDKSRMVDLAKDGSFSFLGFEDWSRLLDRSPYGCAAGRVSGLPKPDATVAEAVHFGGLRVLSVNLPTRLLVGNKAPGFMSSPPRRCPALSQETENPFGHLTCLRDG